MYEEYESDPRFRQIKSVMADTGDISSMLEYLQAQGALPEEKEDLTSENNLLKQQIIENNMRKKQNMYPQGTDMFYELQNPGINLEDDVYQDMLNDIY